MSRRESRVSGNIRQNDALLEFENFKKRFLLANKHITKLNSTLSVKIEELNAQVSALYVENLRLRSSEIALSAQLKREKEKSRSIMADAEAATMTLMNHLGSLRESYKVPLGKYSPRSSSSPSPLRTRPLITNPSPAIPRIARAPNIPEIQEEDERGDSPIPHTRRKSSSRLPLPTRRHSSPPPVDPDEPPTKPKKKSSRRQSGLVDPPQACDSPPPRPPSADIAPTPSIGDSESPFPVFREDDDVEIELPKKKKKPKRREREEDPVLLVIEGSTTTFRLKDVTNSPRSRAFLPPLDTNVATELERQHTPDLASEAPTSATSTHTTSTRAFLTTPATTPAPTTPATYLPTPRGSSSPPPEAESTNVGGREKRVRKSVNYTEPKLNTKMRKPDSTSSAKRASQASREDSPPTSQPPSSSSSPSEQVPSLRRKKKLVQSDHDDDIIDVDEDDGDEADAEYGGIRDGTPWASVGDKRRRSAQSNSVAKGRSVASDEVRRHSLTV